MTQNAEMNFESRAGRKKKTPLKLLHNLPQLCHDISDLALCKELELGGKSLQQFCQKISATTTIDYFTKCLPTSCTQPLNTPSLACL